MEDVAQGVDGLFAAIGDRYSRRGALILGLVIEWSTLFFDARWKVTVGFVVLIVVLVVRPQGIFGKAKAI